MLSTRNLREGDIVWAKVRGHSWWPARLIEVVQHSATHKDSARVEFIGDNTKAVVSLSLVADYESNYSKFSETKRKGRLKAISAANILANRIHSEHFGTKLKADELAGKRLLPEQGVSSCEEAKGILEDLVKQKDASLAIAYSKVIMRAVDTIEKTIHDHYTIQRTNIGFLLQKFTQLYQHEPFLKPVIKHAAHTLKSLKELVINAYFGPPPPVEKAAEKPARRRQRKLTAETEAKSPAHIGLMINVCQELAKVMEDVFVSMSSRKCY